ncbi:hypothetical protein [Sphingomonas crocodyli]|uniref:Uncharacterized protein n=1 Tax=Sphingomonas crocodyli TaxID=1979270 RepID=A0A437M6E8_9SPHN|nr:hypothetical protein [Sphingomonas crocodyli]RVT93074.1 hypothetical protein EOD43_04020 [Sphingomonas crocodyli]
MAETMVERVARALAQANPEPRDPDAPQPNGEPTWKLFAPMAQRAMEAMREPTDGMKEAGAEVTRYIGTNEAIDAYEGDAANVWRLMVDAAIGSALE